MSRLDRYVFREAVGPLTLGFLVYTFILLLQFLFESAEMIIRRDVQAELVGELILLNLPHIVVLTIPMALLFGVMIAVGRLNADSELIAMRASGISLFYLYRSIFLLSFLVAAFNAYLMISVLPRANYRAQLLQAEILTQGIAKTVEPRIFYEDLSPEHLLYVFEIPPGGKRWSGVFLAEQVPKTQNQIHVAEEGEVQVTPDGEQVILHLINSTTHELNLNDPEDANIGRHETWNLLLTEQSLSSQRARRSESKMLRERSLSELQEVARDPAEEPTRRNLALVEVHKKFSIPAACLVFGLFGVPLGFNNRRGGKSSGFALSIAVILVYYIVMNNGEEAAALGRWPPWLAMWSPNILFMVIGSFLLWRRNRDKSLLIGNIDRWVRESVWDRINSLRERRQTRARERPIKRRGLQGSLRGMKSDIVLRLPRLRLRFPNLFDRYLITVFVRVFLLVLASGISVYIIADFTELIDHILKNEVPSDVVLDYYKYYSLEIFYLISPVLVLVTTLITFSLLSRTNEITAAKALGMSLYRLALPAIVMAMVIAGLNVLLEYSVLPAASGKRAELEDRIKGRERVASYRRASRQWLFGRVGQVGYIYNYMYYDPERETVQRLQVFRFDEDYDLTGRLFAAKAKYEDGRWLVDDGWVRTYTDHGVDYARLDGEQPVDIPEEPAFFDTERKRPEQMYPRELRHYIAELRESGQDVPELEVQLYSKVAMPVVCLVMTLVALPFAFRLGKRGALYGVGISLVLGMVFYALMGFFTTLGETAALPPIIAVWSPNMIFSLLSLYLFLGVRT